MAAPDSRSGPITTVLTAPSTLETPAGLTRHAFRAMGTGVTVLVPVGHDELAGRAERLFADWEARLSRFRPDSELSRLNAAAGREVLVGDLLYSVTEAALSAAAATGGLFDPTLLHPLIEAGYDRSFEWVAGHASTDVPERLASAPGSTIGGWRDVHLDPVLRSITLPAGLGLDLGGIAKGMAVDAAVAAMAAGGIQPVAVEAGGDLAVLGPPPPDGWSIAVETGTTVTMVDIDGGALATSSVGKRRWRRDGEIRHHLLDPRTGRPSASDAWSVTVAAASCRQAEVAAKVALILGATEGAAFLERFALDGLITTTDGRLVRVGPWAPT